MCLYVRIIKENTERKALTWKCMRACVWVGGGVAGSDGISCLKGKVKESEAICGEKLTTGNLCLSDCHSFVFEGYVMV